METDVVAVLNALVVCAWALVMFGMMLVKVMNPELTVRQSLLEFLTIARDAMREIFGI